MLDSAVRTNVFIVYSWSIENSAPLILNFTAPVNELSFAPAEQNWLLYISFLGKALYTSQGKSWVINLTSAQSFKGGGKVF